jgi:hypothetical protein
MLGATRFGSAAMPLMAARLRRAGVGGLGELFRAEFFKKSFGLSRIWGLTSIVIERLFDDLTVVACLGLGLFLTATTRQGADIVIDVLGTGGILFGTILLAALCLSGSLMSRILSRFPRLSARMGMVQSGFGILRTWRMLQIAILTLMVKAVGLAPELADPCGLASLSTLVPSGPAFPVLAVRICAGNPVRRRPCAAGQWQQHWVNCTSISHRARRTGWKALLYLSKFRMHTG